jgi:hypothetical protein
LQAVLIVGSLGVDIPLDLSAIARSLGLLLAIMSSSRSTGSEASMVRRQVRPGGDLGPIYGPRYMRTQSKILVVFMVAVIAC